MLDLWSYDMDFRLCYVIYGGYDSLSKGQSISIASIVGSDGIAVIIWQYNLISRWNAWYTETF